MGLPDEEELMQDGGNLKAANLIDAHAAAGNKHCKKKIAASSFQSATQAALVGKGLKNRKTTGFASGGGGLLEEEEELPAQG